MSIIVPAHNSAGDIAACLAAIRESTIPVVYELIVIDDASTDDTSSIGAPYADRVLALDGRARGPAFARNKGVEISRAPVVAFVDSDVIVHNDAIGRMLSSLRARNSSAVFGSYDENPSAPGIVSQYRNLLHYFVHQNSSGYVQSFWAGCGAVKKSAFQAVGGFDSARFHHAEMEDVELGYRLIDEGFSIVLDPAIKCTHRKNITLATMVKSDFTRRGVPWARVLLDRAEFLRPRGLSLSAWEIGSALSAALFAVALAASMALRSTSLAVIALAAVLVFILSNAGLFRGFNRLRGAAFAVTAVPLHLIYSITAVSALGYAFISYPFNRSAPARYKPRQ